MVEIALAMAIIAIGLSSILVLFPVGINANKAAIADNNLTDVAEYMISYMRAGCATEWRKIAEDGKTGSAAGSDYFFSNGMEDNFDDLTAAIKDEEAEGYPDDSTNENFTKYWTPFGSSTGGTRLYRHKTSNGVFLFRQVSLLTDQDGTTEIEVPDFSAVIKIWKDTKSLLDIYVPYVYASDSIPCKKLDEIREASGYTKNQLLEYLDKRYGKALCLELSWPAEVPYENREKRVFRFEVFNEYYTVNSTTPTP